MGLPTHAFSGKDIQNDREHALCLSPAFFEQNQWDSLGMLLYAFMIGLTTGCWLGADSFSAEELLENSLTGYYLLLQCVWQISEKEGVTKVGDVFLSITTMRTLVWNAAHMVERVLGQTSGAFSPPSTVEQCAEQHFGRVKGGQGTLTLKSYLLACQRLHIRQSREPAMNKKPVRTWQGLSEAAAKDVGHRSFRSACVFVAIATCGQSPKQIGEDFVKWYESVGHGIIMDKSGREAPAHEDVVEDELSDGEEEGRVAGSEEVQTLQDLEFQASVKADIDQMMHTVEPDVPVTPAVSSLAADSLQELPEPDVDVDNSAHATESCAKRQKVAPNTLFEMLRCQGRGQ